MGTNRCTHETPSYAFVKKAVPLGVGSYSQGRRDPPSPRRSKLVSIEDRSETPSSCDSATLPNPTCLLQRLMRTVLWLTSSWDLNSAFADQPLIRHFIGSWDLTEQHKTHKTRAKWKLLNSCSTSEHLVESRATGETFMVKWYRKTGKGLSSKRKMKALMVFKLDEEGNAVYTQEIGEIVFDPPCPFTSPDPNQVIIVDVNDSGFVNLDGSNHYNLFLPQKIDS